MLRPHRLTMPIGTRSQRYGIFTYFNVVSVSHIPRFALQYLLNLLLPCERNKTPVEYFRKLSEDSIRGRPERAMSMALPFSIIHFNELVNVRTSTSSPHINLPLLPTYTSNLGAGTPRPDSRARPIFAGHLSC